MSESESSDVEEVSSQKIPECHDTVPREIKYSMKFLGSQSSKFVFTLKQGKALPYETSTITKKGRGNLKFLNLVLLENLSLL